MRRVIPVLDIRQGQVVQAVRGERADYQPIRSVLTPDTKPGAVVEAVLALFAFPVFYLADLDALMGEAPQSGLIVELCTQHPNVEFWIDAGPIDPTETPWPENARAVYGTEYTQDWPQHDIPVLSLDFDQTGLIGGQQIWAQPQRWPEQVIAMALHRVGSLHGPDWPLLQRLRNHAPKRRWIAAGGLRDAMDVRSLLEADYDVLVASALHRGTVTREDLQALL